MSHNKRPREPQREPYHGSATTVPRNRDQGSARLRPSALPRSISGNSFARLDALAASRSQPAQVTASKLTSQHSRSASEDVPLVFDTSPRLKEGQSASMRTSQAPGAAARPAWAMDSDTIFGVHVPEKRHPVRTPDLPTQLIPELQALASHYRPYPLPPSSVSTISSPSTHFTESPAPWSASTATTTPISWPSSSPAILQTAATKSQTVPQQREPRSRLPKLPNTRHEPTKQKSTNVSEPSPQAEPTDKSTRRKNSLRESPAPTPPPRTSSVKRNDRGDSRSRATSIDETLSRVAVSTAPALSGAEPNSLVKRTAINFEWNPSLPMIPTTSATHAILQQSIGVAPARPSREGTTDLGESRPAVINDYKAGFSDKHRQLLASAFEDAAPTRPTTSSSRDTETGGIQRSPSKLSKLSRLGFFTRRGANSSASNLERSPSKLQRRGPAAGTGHEGYGKYAKRGRKTSSESSATGSDSEQSVSSMKRKPLISSSRRGSGMSFQQNRTSQSDLDKFAAPRLKPVIMRGGSQTSVERSNAFSGYEPSRSNTPASAQVKTFGSQFNTVDPSRIPTAVRSPLLDVTRSQGKSPATAGSMPHLALRRSQKFGPGHEDFRMPSPIRTDDLVAPLYITSKDTSESSLAPSSTPPSLMNRDVHRNDPTLSRVQEKKSRKHWWNPFRRRHQTPAPIEQVYKPAPGPAEMSVSIATAPAPRSIPYYAVMESESENNTAEAIGDYLSQAIESPPPSPVSRQVAVGEPASRRRTESILLPAAPVWSEDAAPPSPNSSTYDDETSYVGDLGTKTPRLAQVGRIPKVVTRHERQHTPSRRSFSQPFAKKVVLEDASPEHERLQDLYIERPQLAIHTDVLPSRPFSGIEDVSAKPASAPARTTYPESTASTYRRTNVPPFSSKHESEMSYSSSSDGMHSVMGPPLIPSQRERELRAQIPALRIASGLPADDEIWKEYDDFLDHVMSPSIAKKQKEQLLGPPLQPRIMPASSSLEAGGNRKRSSQGKLPIIDPRKAVLDLSLPATGTPSITFPSPSLLSDRSVSDEIRLRRSRVVSALRSSVDPTSPFSMQEFLNDYGVNGPESAALHKGFSTPTAPGNTGPIIPISGASMVDKAEHTHDENAHLLDSAERAENPVKQSELHYASLEVARWLSFGRVLFSPAHEEIHTLPERNVLVIDGLGNEDWSIYCAVTYESDNAIIYDLKEDSSSGLSQNSRDSGHMPANHRRRAVSSLSDRFPFHSAFFSAIVLRFPPVMSEAKMQSIITECRRVLMPGGHLEIMLLELDIVNMGMQTRRAVRDLKMRMTDSAPDLDLKPTIDNFQTLLGGRGFTGLSRCIVGVPVTGRPAGSVDSSTSSRSSHGSGSYPRRTSAGSPYVARSAHPARGHNFSLNDLVADHSENADAKIGRMVSRTARSWWQHCYEADVMAIGNQSSSIFSDKRVMQECKSRASSFKLLIAYAQRPVFESKRRTMSEWGTSTMAIAGAQRRARPAS